MTVATNVGLRCYAKARGYVPSRGAALPKAMSNRI